MMIIVNRLVIIAGLSFLLIHAYACEKNQNPDEATVDARIDEFSSCKSKDDCVLIKADCCGCTRGGKQRAVNKNAAKGMFDSMAQACKDTMCMQMISTDPSCAQSLACVDGECKLL